LEGACIGGNRRQGRSMASVKVLKGEDAGRSFKLSSAIPNRIGRSPDNEVQLSDTRVSANHSIIECNGGIWFLADMGSRNGSYVNKERVAQKKALFDGDRILIGKTLLEMDEEE